MWIKKPVCIRYIYILFFGIKFKPECRKAVNQVYYISIWDGKPAFNGVLRFVKVVGKNKHIIPNGGLIVMFHVTIRKKSPSTQIITNPK